MLVLRCASVVVNAEAVPFDENEVVVAAGACGDSPRREVKTSSSEALLGERSTTKLNGRIVELRSTLICFCLET